MLTVFQVCFFVGLGLTLISAIVGHVFEFIDIHGMDFHIDIPGIDMHLPLSPTIYVLFLTVFGGIGWICTISDNPFSQTLILIIAIASGITSSYLLFKLVIAPLRKAQNTSTPEESELIGLLATVSEKIFEKGFGEISYIINGNSYTSPAKSTNGEEILQGSEVAICFIEERIFYVSQLK